MSDEATNLPIGWAETTIGELLAPLADGRTLHHGWSPQCEKEPSPTEEEWGVLKTTAIQPGAFLPEHNKRLPARLKPRSQLEVSAGELLITCAGPRSRCGVACLVRTTRKRLILSGKMYRFRMFDGVIDPRFMEAYFQTDIAQHAIDGMKTGISDSGLNLTHGRFRQLVVHFAPFNEQRRIVDLLDELFSDLDAGVAALERVRTKLRHYRVTVLKAAVEGALTAEWRKQHLATERASALLTRILAERRHRWEQDQLRKFTAAGKEPPQNWKAKYEEPAILDTTDFPPLPEGWCWATLDMLVGQSPQNGAYYHKQLYGSGTPIIRIDDYQDFSSRPSNELQRVNCSQEDATLYRVDVDDLLINRVNSLTHLGKGLLIEDRHTPAIFESNMMRLRFSRLVVSAFVLHYLRSPSGRQRLRANAKWAVNQASINQQDVLCTTLPLPSLAEQEAIVEAVEDQLSVIEHIEADVAAKLKSAQALRQSILRHAFTGQLVPQDPHDEPASELLKRIAADRDQRTRQAQAAKSPKSATAAKRGRRKKGTP